MQHLPVQWIRGLDQSSKEKLVKALETSKENLVISRFLEVLDKQSSETLSQLLGSTDRANQDQLIGSLNTLNQIKSLFNWRLPS